MSGPDLLGALAAGLDPAALGGPGDAAHAAPSDRHREARTADGEARCSRRGCTAAAVWALEWNNPRVHAPERRKTWVACEEHRAHLTDFLASRGFLRRVRALSTNPQERP